MTTGAAPPFLDVQSFVQEEGEEPRPAPPGGPWSPFVSVYESAEWEHQAGEPLREAYATLVNDLYDEEFDESLYELLTSAQGLHQDRLVSGLSLAEADRVVMQHFSQLIAESESMLDAMARELGSRDVVTIDQELDQFAEQYVPASPLEPEFQEFLGKLARKIGKGVRTLAKTAVKGITTLGLGAILSRIKAIVPMMLKQVMQKAIGRLPEAVRPAATTLAQRLGFAVKPPAPPTSAAPAATPLEPPASAGAQEPAAAPTPEPAPGPEPAVTASAPLPQDADSPVQPTATSEVPDLQLELDEFLAEAMLSDDEVELELELARISSHAAATSVLADLDRARERFAQELDQLKEGESPAPYVENFLPALLPALRVTMRLIGRPRVVNFLAGLLGKLITNLIGPQQAPALSRAIVDAGLKLVNLEAEDEAPNRLATAAVTATVEETLTRVASLPDHILDNQELLEGFALEAFEQAAAANLPPVFADATYRKRPDLLEGGVNATWIMLPLRRPRYKRCSRSFNVTITPHMAEAVESFEDAALAEYLQDQLGFEEGETLETEVHLFEVLPGGTAADIVRNETETPGLGAADEATLSQLQPLTNEAASVLLGKPGLGRTLRPGSNVRTLVPGQRLYHLDLGRRPLTAATVTGRPRVRRLVRVHVILDAVRDQLRVCVFLSEVKAQRLAVRFRQQSHVGALTVAFHKLLGRRLPHILHGRRRRRLRIVHASVAPGATPAAVFDRLPAIVSQAFIVKVQEWLTGAFTEFAKTQAQSFLTAAEAPADGVTLRFTIDHPPGLKEIGQFLAQGGAAGPGIAESLANAAAPTVHVDAVPGLKSD
jgi:hypothetical protein